MYQFSSLQLVNYSLWDEVEFEFEEGVTLVTGGNGSGKSLLFSPLTPLFYDTSPIPKNAKATLELSNERHNFDFSVLRQSKKNRFEINIDGKKQKTERINDAKNVIEQHFVRNIQESIFSTTVTLSGLGRHPLATGKPASRLDWVHETLAYASILDSYVDDVERQIKDTKTKSVKYSLLLDQYNGMEQHTKPEVNVDELKKILDEVTEYIKTNERQRSDIEYALKHKSSKLEKPELSYEEAKDQFEKIEKKLNELLEQQKQVEIHKERNKTARKLKEKLEAAKLEYKELCKAAKLPAISPKYMLETLVEITAKYKKELREAERSNETYEEQADLRAFRKKYRDYKISTNDMDKYYTRISALAEKVNIDKLKITAHSSGDKFCSVCGSDFKDGHTDLKEIKQNLRKNEEQIRKWELEIKIVESRLFKLAKHVDTDELETALANTNNLGRVATKYVDIKERLDELDLPENIEFDEAELNKIEKIYKKRQKQLVDAQVYRKTQKELGKVRENKYFELSSKKLKANLEKVEENLIGLYKRQRSLNDEIIQTETKLVLYRRYKEERKKLVEEITELKKYAKDHKLLTVLKKALGRDGFRTKRLESTLELFVDNLNSLAPLLWREPFKFEIETGPRKCDLVIHRNKQDGNAFTLSGSEQRRWQLLAGLSMLRLLPNNRRCNTIILDELEANMDESIRHRMMNDFIPELLKTVPNVVIVSPMTQRELSLKPDRAYFVEKRNAKSKLITA